MSLTAPGTVGPGYNAGVSAGAPSFAGMPPVEVPAPTGIVAFDQANIQTCIANAAAQGGGVVQFSAGTYRTASSGRVDSCTFNLTATVQDPSCVASDVGSVVTGFAGVGYATILSVNPGVSFVMSQTSSSNGTFNAIITKPVGSIPPGVILEGYGATYDRATESMFVGHSAGTKILDTGTGITFAVQGTITSQSPSNCSLRSTFRNMAIYGQNTNMYGIFVCNAVFMLTIYDCEISFHGFAGLGLGESMNTGYCVNTIFAGNGKPAATGVTGGVIMYVNTNYPTCSQVFVNCVFNSNYGWGIVSGAPWAGGTPSGATGIVLIGGNFNNTLASAASGSGVQAWLAGRQADGTTATASSGTGFYGPCVTNLKTDGSVGAFGCTFGGPTNTNNVVVNSSGFIAVGSMFNGASSGVSIARNNHAIYWIGCNSLDTFITDTIPAAAAAGYGYIPDQASLSGTSAGTITYYQDNGGTYKRVVMTVNGYENTTVTAQTITYPVAFSKTPVITANSTTMTLSTTPTALTLPTSMGATVNGVIIVEGV